MDPTGKKTLKKNPTMDKQEKQRSKRPLPQNILQYSQTLQIAMEPLNIRGMLKSNLSRSIHEIGWGKLIEMIKYKARWYGREFVQIDRWFPSSKKCNVCGKINHDLDCSERVWECPHCHSVHLRDVNAAINILDEGLRAAGASVQCLVDFIHICPSKFIYQYEWNSSNETICMT